MKSIGIGMLAVSPALLMGSFLVAREALRDDAPPSKVEGALVTPLPLTLEDLDRSRAGRVFVIDPDRSRVGLESQSSLIEMSAQTRPFDGQVRFDASGRPTALDVTLDLQGFRAGVALAEKDLVWNLLAGRDDSTARLSSESILARDTDIPQVFELTAICRISLHGRVRVLQMVLHMAQMRPESMRVQATATLDTLDFGLPRLEYLGVVPVESRVTVWLDLMFSSVRPGGKSK